MFDSFSALVHWKKWPPPIFSALIALGAILKTSFSMPLVTGSLPAKTDKNGLSDVLKNSRATLCASKDLSGTVSYTHLRAHET